MHVLTELQDETESEQSEEDSDIKGKVMTMKKKLGPKMNSMKFLHSNIKTYYVLHKISKTLLEAVSYWTVSPQLTFSQTRNF